MSSNPLRKFLRQRARDFSYDHYAKDQVKVNQKNRMIACVARTREDWKREFMLAVPVWQGVVASKIPPKWYPAFFQKIAENLPPDGYISKVLALPVLPLWMKKCMIHPFVLVRWAMLKLFRDPVVWLRRTIMTLGVTTTYRRKKNDVVEMTMRRWGRKFYKNTYKM
jgi:hypothetical protein